MEQPGVELELNTTQYNVNRISRLVNMYHAFHHYTDGHEERDLQVERGKPASQSRSFLCPKCQKRTWRSIETYRVHKSHCKKETAGVGATKLVRAPEEVHHCGDCQAVFRTAQEYRDHVTDRQDDGQQHTWVCPYHCGNGKIDDRDNVHDFNFLSAFSQNSCLQHHSVECFAKQTMGPFNVIICKDN